jgi:hypothetical protein
MKAFFKLRNEPLNVEFIVRVANGKFEVRNQSGNRIDLGFISQDGGALSYALEDASTKEDAMAALKQYMSPHLTVTEWSPPKAPGDGS